MNNQERNKIICGNSGLGDFTAVLIYSAPKVFRPLIGKYALWVIFIRYYLVGYLWRRFVPILSQHQPAPSFNPTVMWRLWDAIKNTWPIIQRLVTIKIPDYGLDHHLTPRPYDVGKYKPNEVRQTLCISSNLSSTGKVVSYYQRIQNQALNVAVRKLITT